METRLQEVAASDAEELRRRGNLALKRLSRHPEASGLLLEAARRQAEGNVREARHAYLDALVAAGLRGPRGAKRERLRRRASPERAAGATVRIDRKRSPARRPLELHTTGHAEARPDPAPSSQGVSW
jgi:hypothetical protein